MFVINRLIRLVNIIISINFHLFIIIRHRATMNSVDLSIPEDSFRAGLQNVAVSTERSRRSLAVCDSLSELFVAYLSTRFYQEASRRVSTEWTAEFRCVSPKFREFPAFRVPNAPANLTDIRMHRTRRRRDSTTTRGWCVDSAAESYHACPINNR